MALSYKARRRLALVLLLVWLPIYILIMMGLLGRMPRMNVLIEVVVYAFAAFAWLLPFRFVFRGVGRPDPEKGAPEFLDDALIAKDKEKYREPPQQD